MRRKDNNNDIDTTLGRPKTQTVSIIEIGTTLERLSKTAKKEIAIPRSQGLPRTKYNSEIARLLDYYGPHAMRVQIAMLLGKIPLHSLLMQLCESMIDRAHGKAVVRTESQQSVVAVHLFQEIGDKLSSIEAKPKIELIGEVSSAGESVTS